MSRTYEDKLAQELLGNTQKRSNSLDRLRIRIAFLVVIKHFVILGSQLTGKVLPSSLELGNQEHFLSYNPDYVGALTYFCQNMSEQDQQIVKK